MPRRARAATRSRSRSDLSGGCRRIRAFAGSVGKHGGCASTDRLMRAIPDIGCGSGRARARPLASRLADPRDRQRGDARSRRASRSGSASRTSSRRSSFATQRSRRSRAARRSTRRISASRSCAASSRATSRALHGATTDAAIAVTASGMSALMLTVRSARVAGRPRGRRHAAVAEPGRDTEDSLGGRHLRAAAVRRERLDARSSIGCSTR